MGLKTCEPFNNKQICMSPHWGLCLYGNTDQFFVPHVYLLGTGERGNVKSILHKIVCKPTFLHCSGYYDRKEC